MNRPYEQIGKLERMSEANRLIVELSKRPTWTIATGAMLVSGLRAEHATESMKVPDDAVWLLDESMPAKPMQLHRARQVLARWIEDHQDEDDESATQPDEASPLDFLLWCDDVYQGTPRAMKPEWLDYLALLIEAPTESAPIFGAIGLAEGALGFERITAVVKQTGRSLDSGLSGFGAVRPNKYEAGFFVRKTEPLFELGSLKAPYAMPVAEAQDRAVAAANAQGRAVFPFLQQDIWGHLVEMVRVENRWPYVLRIKPASRAGKPPELEVESAQGWESFLREDLQQYLRRLKVKLVPQQSTESDSVG